MVRSHHYTRFHNVDNRTAKCLAAKSEAAAHGESLFLLVYKVINQAEQWESLKPLINIFGEGVAAVGQEAIAIGHFDLLGMEHQSDIGRGNGTRWAHVAAIINSFTA